MVAVPDCMPGPRREAVAAPRMLQERKGQKRITRKAPAVLGNLFKRIFGGKKSKQPAAKEAQEEKPPVAVPLDAPQQPAVAAA